MADTTTASIESKPEWMAVNEANRGWQTAKAMSGLSCRCPARTSRKGVNGTRAWRWDDQGALGRGRAVVAKGRT